MHPNPAFRTTPEARNLEFARDRGFGVLVVAGAAPLISHIPVLISKDGARAEFHLVRSNPIARLKGRHGATLIFTGPEGYVSPDWYGLEDQVPTWNYVAVHLSGQMEIRPESKLDDLLARQSAAFEARLAPKPPWTMDKMTPDARRRMQRMIVPARLKIEMVEGTWKLNQNKPAEARAAAAEAIRPGAPDLAALMSKPQPGDSE